MQPCVRKPWLPEPAEGIDFLPGGIEPAAKPATTHGHTRNTQRLHRQTLVDFYALAADTNLRHLDKRKVPQTDRILKMTQNTTIQMHHSIAT
jgi:hypothetical protein